MWPGREDRLDAEPAHLDRLARLDRPVHLVDQLGLDRVGHDLHAVAVLPHGVLRHVVAVVMGEQQELDVEAVPLGRLEQRL